MVYHSTPHEVFYSSECSTSIEWSGNALKVKEFAEGSGYAVRVIKDKRVGFTYTEEAKNINNAIKLAEKIAKFSHPSDFSFPTNNKFAQVKTFDKNTASLDEKSLKDILDELKGAALRHTKRTRIILNSGQVRTELMNSEGLKCGYDSTLFSLYVEAMNDDGFGFESHSSISAPIDVVTFGTSAGKMAHAMKGAKKLENGKYTIVFSADAFSQLLSILLPSFSGDWQRRKVSRIYDATGKKIFDKALSLYESPSAAGVNIRPFDDEGIASRTFPLIEDGVVKNFMYDREIAALAKVPHTFGCCVRPSYEAFPSIGHSNLVIKQGDWTNLEDELKECLLVHSIHGVHTANTTTGDFGVEANIAFYIKNNVSTPKRGFMISGNVFSMFSSIEAIEKSTTTHHDLTCPRMAFSGLQVVG